MRRSLHRSETGQTFRGLLVDVDAPARPGLRIETVAGRRSVVVQGDQPVMWCRIWSDHYGVDVCPDRALSPVLDPMRADTARRLAGDDPAVWYERWTHHLVEGLAQATNGPLHVGRWTARPVAHRGDRSWPALVPLDGMDPDEGDIDWWANEGEASEIHWDSSGSSLPLIPLRPLSPPDAGRVKAYRKLARDRTLPPVVVWFVSGLVAYLIIDGHDRLVAATVEGFSPPIISVTRVRPVEEARARGGGNDLAELARFEQVLRTQPELDRVHEVLARQVVRATVRAEEVPITAAWPSDLSPDRWPNPAGPSPEGS